MTEWPASALTPMEGEKRALLYACCSSLMEAGHRQTEQDS